MNTQPVHIRWPRIVGKKLPRLPLCSNEGDSISFEHWYHKIDPNLSICKFCQLVAENMVKDGLTLETDCWGNICHQKESI